MFKVDFLYLSLHVFLISNIFPFGFLKISLLRFTYYTVHPFEVYSLAAFSIIYHRVLQTHQFLNIFIISERNLIPIRSQSPFLPQTFPHPLLSLSIDLPILDISYKQNHITCSLL